MGEGERVSESESERVRVREIKTRHPSPQEWAGIHAHIVEDEGGGDVDGVSARAVS